MFKNPLRMDEVLIEYVVECGLGEVPVKIIVSDNLKALLKMY